MSVTDKVRAVINLSGKAHGGLAEHLEISSQSLSNKLNRGSFSAEDLIKISEYAGCSLAFEFSDGQKVSLMPGDIRSK